MPVCLTKRASRRRHARAHQSVRAMRACTDRFPRRMQAERHSSPQQRAAIGSRPTNKVTSAHLPDMSQPATGARGAHVRTCTRPIRRVLSSAVKVVDAAPRSRYGENLTARRDLKRIEDDELNLEAKHAPPRPIHTHIRTHLRATARARRKHVRTSPPVI